MWHRCEKVVSELLSPVVLTKADAILRASSPALSKQPVGDQSWQLDNSGEPFQEILVSYSDHITTRAFLPTFSCVSILRWRGPLRFALGVDQRRSSPMEPCGRIDRWVGLQLQLLRWICDLCKTVWRCLLSNFGFQSAVWVEHPKYSDPNLTWPSQSWAIHFSSDFSFQWPLIRSI